VVSALYAENKALVLAISHFATHVAGGKMDNINTIGNIEITNDNSGSERNVFRPADHENGTLVNTHRISRIGMGIRREDTRHGGTSLVYLWKPKKGKSRRFTLSLAEARSLKAFLDRELEIKAR
jgi:hypothetical protein